MATGERSHGGDGLPGGDPIGNGCGGGGRSYGVHSFGGQDRALPVFPLVVIHLPLPAL